MAVFSTSVSPLAFVYLGETSSDHLRAKTISLATSAAAIVNLVIDYCIPLALNNQHFDLSYAGEYTTSLPSPSSYELIASLVIQLHWRRWTCYMFLIYPGFDKSPNNPIRQGVRGRYPSEVVYQRDGPVA
jgi:hypothetical protein